MLRPIGEPAHNGCSEMLSEPVVRSERAGAAARIQGLCHLISYNAPFVAIGRALQPFPRSKPGRPVFWHPAFQLDRSTRQGRIDRCRSNGAPEGLMVASAFRSPSVYLPLDRFTLADLHPVVPITATHSATTPPPSSLPRAGIFAPHSLNLGQI